MSEPGSGLVSVLVPTFNGERFLADALRSAVSQTHAQLEIIVCDDGSSDATLEIAQGFAVDDPRIRVHENRARLGVVGNFERCLRVASGAYIKYLMQDDVLQPSAIARLLDPLRGSDDVVLAASRRTRIGADGKPLPDRPETLPPYAQDTVVDGRALGNLVLEKNLNLIGEPSAVLFRRSALGDVKPFSLGGAQYRYLADLALWLTLLGKGQAAYLVEPLCLFRHHADQDSGVRTNMVTSVLEWQRLRREAEDVGFLASAAARERTCRRWLENAPFFFRFCSGVPEAATLFSAIVAANVERLRLAAAQGQWHLARSMPGAIGSCLRALLWFPIGGLLARRIHRARSARRR